LRICRRRTISGLHETLQNHPRLLHLKIPLQLVVVYAFLNSEDPAECPLLAESERRDPVRERLLPAE